MTNKYETAFNSPIKNRLSLLKHIADPEDQLPKITYWLRRLRQYAKKDKVQTNMVERISRNTIRLFAVL